MTIRELLGSLRMSKGVDTTREKLLVSSSAAANLDVTGASSSSSNISSLLNSAELGGSDANLSSSSDGKPAAAESRTKTFWGKLLEPNCPRAPINPDKWLYNPDFAPIMEEGRILTAKDMASLWVMLVVGVPTYYLAGSLVEMGMAWWQGIITVFLANVIVLIPMVLSSHAGTKFGIPFPVIARAPFGIVGANVPALLRAFIGCGWFGIQTWIGGQAIFQLLNTLLAAHHAVDPAPLPSHGWPVIPWLGISAPEFASFMLFWLLQVGIIWNGIASIKQLEKYSAPILIVLSCTLLAWAYIKAGGFGPILSAPSQFVPGGAKAGQFWQVFFPALTANVGCWVSLTLNIPALCLIPVNLPILHLGLLPTLIHRAQNCEAPHADFTRFSKSQADQVAGQAIGLPLFMAAFSFIGVAVTSATITIFGRAISDPIEVMSLIGGLFPTLLALIGVILAVLASNIAANVVGTANSLVNLNPQIFSFRGGAIFTAVLGILLAPWRLIQSSQGFIFTWLIGYSALLGPVGGIMLVDYFWVRDRSLDINALYSSDEKGPYWYTKGFNLSALVALVAGILPNVPGFLAAAGITSEVPLVFSVIYSNSWFVGVFLGGLVYWLLSEQQIPKLNRDQT